MVEGEAEGHGAEAADASISGLEADDAAEGGGDADGAAGIAAHGHEDHTGCDGRAGSTAGAAGDAIAIPRVAHDAEVGIAGGDAVGEFMHAGLGD